GIRVEDYGISVKLKYIIAYLFALFFLRPFEKLFLDENDAIIVHYSSTKDMLTREFGVNPKRIMKIPYHVELYEKGAPHVLNPKKGNGLEDVIKKRPLCVTVCRQEPRKGINYLIRAVKVILDSGHVVNTVVVGSGSLLEKNKKLARKLGIEDNILFTGFVADVLPFLQNADLFVFSSLQEGSGALSILDAMKMGVPIVSTACDGIREDIEDGVSGLLVPPRNEYVLAKRIIELINDKKLATELGRNAANEWRRRFDAKKMVEGIRDCYRVIEGI
ncbi:MAG: glycosyltransferase family 4 protein, partial [Candidatus Heimdallarchaeota archaeon]